MSAAISRRVLLIYRPAYRTPALAGGSATRALLSTSTARRQSNPVQPTTQPADRFSPTGWTPNLTDRMTGGASSVPPSHTSKLPPRLGPTAGRSVAIRGGDIGGAFSQLRRVCGENSIARDSSIQRFYERPGVKKKRLRRERFRRRFKESFKRMVGTVLEMKRQGI